MASIKFLDDFEIERLKRVWVSWENSEGIKLENGHSIWNKSVTNKGYGRVGVTFIMKSGLSVSKRMLAHVLSYFLKDSSFDFFISKKDREVSHLCREQLCVKPEHLNLESHGENIKRKNCHKQNYCFGHGENPKCIFS